MFPFPQKPFGAEQHEGEGEEQEVVPEGLRGLARGEGDAIADGEIVQEAVGVGEGIESAVGFLGGTFISCWFMRRRSISPGGARTRHSALGLGSATVGELSQKRYSPSG